MKNKPNTVNQLRTIYLRYSNAEALETFISRIEQNLPECWNRELREEQSLEKVSNSKTFCFNLNNSKRESQSVLYISVDDLNAKVASQPPLNKYGSYPPEILNQALDQFLADFRPVLEELEIAYSFSPDAVDIEAFVGSESAKDFNVLVREHKDHHSTFASPHFSKKWTTFVCSAYRANSRSHLTSSKLAAVLKKHGFSKELAEELGTRWESGCELLSHFEKSMLVEETDDQED